MSADLSAPEFTVWLDGSYQKSIAGLIDVMGGGVRPIAVGGPVAEGRDKLAKDLDVPRFDDLRKMLIDCPAGFLLLGTLEGVGEDDLPMAMARGAIVLSFEPVAREIGELEHLAEPAAPVDGGPHLGGRIVHVPSFERSPGFLAAADPHDALGEQRTLAMTNLGPRSAGSLFARLFDAWVTLLGFVDLPETVSAALTGQDGPVPDNPRELTGRLTAHARLSDGGSTTLLISDQANPTPRRLQALGSESQLLITDEGYTLCRLDGELVDEHAHDGPTGPTDLVALQWRRLIDQRAPAGDPGMTRERAALACCLACQLSARTGQPESPARLAHMSRR